MKKAISLFAFLLLGLTCSLAQVKVSSGSLSMDVQFKRAVAQGNDVFIDLIVTCNTNWEKVGLSGCKIYDDEGNYYNLWDGYGNRGYRIDVIENDERIPLPSGAASIPVARDIPRKVRILVKGVDEYASSFVQISIEWWGDMWRDKSFNSTLKNVPITRD